MGFIKKTQKQLSDRVACIILAGGKGTRLHPLTKKRSKPGVIFGGKYRLIDIPISNSINSEFYNIFVLSQYFAAGLNHHIKQTYHLDHFHGGSIELLTPEEQGDQVIWYEGTADAVRKNLPYFIETDVDYFLILSGDQLYNMNLQDMIDFARKSKADLTIASLPIEKNEASRMGLLKINDKQKIVDFHEKPQNETLLNRFKIPSLFLKKKKISHDGNPKYLASMGIYVFKKEVLIKLLKEDKREDFGKHLIQTQMKKGNSFAYLHQGYWEDIGTVASFYEANLSLTTNSIGFDLYDEKAPIYASAPNLPSAQIKNTKVTDSILCQGCVIEAEEISHSIIGTRSIIREGTVIRDSIILGNQYYHSPHEEHICKPRNYEIGKNCVLEKVIIDENVKIGNHVILTNHMDQKSYDGDGIYIRDGIIVVSSGTILPDGFTL